MFYIFVDLSYFISLFTIIYNWILELLWLWLIIFHIFSCIKSNIVVNKCIDNRRVLTCFFCLVVNITTVKSIFIVWSKECQTIVSKHRWFLNTGKMYKECTTVVIEWVIFQQRTLVKYRQFFKLTSIWMDGQITTDRQPETTKDNQWSLKLLKLIMRVLIIINIYTPGFLDKQISVKDRLHLNWYCCTVHR